MADHLPHLTTALSDRYRIERGLGAGGVATVYLAEDLRHQPTACNSSMVDIAVDAPRGLSRAEDIRSDIWAVNLPGVTR